MAATLSSLWNRAQGNKRPLPGQGGCVDLTVEEEVSKSQLSEKFSSPAHRTHATSDPSCSSQPQQAAKAGHDAKRRRVDDQTPGTQATDIEDSRQPQLEAEAVQLCSQQHPAATDAPSSRLHPPSVQAAALPSPSQTHSEPLPPEQQIQQQSASESYTAGSLTDESKQELFKQYAAAQQRCRQTASSIKPLADLPQCSGGTLVRAEVAAWLVGNAVPLSAAVQQLWHQLNQSQTSVQTEDLVRNCILDLATRKEHGIKGSAGSVADPLEDMAEQHLWRWELRDAKVLPKAMRGPAQAIKKALHEAQEHLTALHNACQCLQSTASGKTAENKLQKALARVHKLSQPSSKAKYQAQTSTTAMHGPSTGANAAQQTAQGQQGTDQNMLEALGRPCTETAATQQSAITATEAHDEGSAQPVGPSQAAPTEQQVTAQSQASRQRIEDATTDADKENAAANTAKSIASKEAAKAARDKDRVQKEALKQQQHAEREQQRLAKEQQKAEKEQQRLEKESQKAEREEQKAAKEAEKERLRLEREAEKEKLRLEKESARREKEMLKAAAEKGKQAVGFGSEKVLKKSQTVFKSFFSARKAEPARDDDRNPLSPSCNVRLEMGSAAAPEEIEQRLSKPLATPKVEQAFAESLREWKAYKRPAPIPGLPPTWARKKDAVPILHRALEDKYGQDYRPEQLRLWRRKLLFHQSGSRNHAFYGSFSRPRQVLNGRRCFKQEPDVDYDVDSDEDWQEEPEDGESLSQMEDSEMEEEEDSQADGFVVEDGYLSEGEGRPMDADEFEAGLEEEVESSLVSAGAAPVERYTHQHNMLLLEAALEKARRLHRPLIITSLPLLAGDPTQIHMDSTMLSALDMQVLDPSIKITMPPAPAEEEDEEAPKPKQTPGTTTKPGQKKGDDWLPSLVMFLLTHPKTKALSKVCTKFQEAHPDQKVAKTRLHAKVKEIAERAKDHWIIQPQALQEAGVEDAEAVRQTVEIEAAATAAGQPAKAAPNRPAHAGSVKMLDMFLRKVDSPAERPLSQPASRRTLQARQADVVDLCMSPADPSCPAPASAAQTSAARDTAEAAAGAAEAMDIDESAEQQASGSGPLASTCAQEGMLPDRHSEDGLMMTQGITSSADPYWRTLSDMIVQGKISSQQQAEQLRQFFAESNADKWQGHVPVYILSALVKAMGTASLAVPVRTACADCAHAILQSAAHQSLQTPAAHTSKIWASNRSAPPTVSLPCIYSDKGLLQCLKDCLGFKNHSSNKLAQSAAQLLCALLSMDIASEHPMTEPAPHVTAQPSIGSEASVLRSTIAGDTAWRKLILEGVSCPSKLANYFSCALYCLLSDEASRQQLHQDEAQGCAILKALQDAARSRELMGVAKYSLKSLLEIVSKSTCFDKAVSESVLDIWEAVADVVTQTGLLTDAQRKQHHRLQLWAIQVMQAIIQLNQSFVSGQNSAGQQKVVAAVQQIAQQTDHKEVQLAAAALLVVLKQLGQ